MGGHSRASAARLAPAGERCGTAARERAAVRRRAAQAGGAPKAAGGRAAAVRPRLPGRPVEAPHARRGRPGGLRARRVQRARARGAADQALGRALRLARARRGPVVWRGGRLRRVRGAPHRRRVRLRGRGAAATAPTPARPGPLSPALVLSPSPSPCRSCRRCSSSRHGCCYRCCSSASSPSTCRRARTVACGMCMGRGAEGMWRDVHGVCGSEGVWRVRMRVADVPA